MTAHFHPAAVCSGFALTDGGGVSGYPTLTPLLGTSAAVTTTLAYDNNGNPTSVNAPLGRNTLNSYDSLNRILQITDPSEGITAFNYDANDRLISVTDPINLTTHYAYNGLGDLLQLMNPATGTTTNTYDSAGNLSIALDARGVGGTYTYDPINRVTQIADGDQTISFTYDAGTNGKGRLTGAYDSVHTMSWQYDPLGRVTGKSQSIGGVTLSTGYLYTNGDLTTLTTPSGQTIVYAYANHQVSGITINGAPLLSNVVYEPFGPTRGWTWAGGTSEIRLHDTDGNPSQISARESSSYTVDSAFRIVGISDASNPANSWSYGYDGLDRLTSAASTGNTFAFTYDGEGNRLSQQGASGPTYNASNIALAYNNRGRLANVTVGGSQQTAYDYNALGQRIRKSGSATVLYSYDEFGHLLGEYSATGALIQETVWFGDLPVATLRPDPTGGIDVYYIHADHINTPKMITRASDGAIMWRWDQDPFGISAPNQNPQALGTLVYNLRFPGQYYDGEAGFSYNYFRTYDPQMGRYLESDPVGLGGGINTYSYADDEPIGTYDRFGLDTAMCTRNLKMGPIPLPRAGPLFHQYVCVGNAKTGYTCRGLGPTGNMFNSPGKLETDGYKPKSCEVVKPENACVESCIKKTFNSSPVPNYSVDLSHGQNCQTYADSTVSECVAHCHANTK